MIRIEDVVKLVGRQLGLKKVKSDDRLRENLGAESMDIQNIVLALEDKYQIAIEEEEIVDLVAVSDLFNLVQAKV